MKSVTVYDCEVVTHDPARPFDHSDPALEPVWQPGVGACICDNCQRKQRAIYEARVVAPSGGDP